VPVSAAGANEDIYLVPFSHLDLYWGGTREECLARGCDLIAKAIRQAKQSPQFRFLLEDNDFVANYLDSHRGCQEVQDLKQLVREGRIEIAPKWAAIYQEMCDGEALARNLVIGKRYAREVFGVDPQVAHLGDIPGYTLQFPQLLDQAKVPYMLMARMGPSDNSLFNWKSPNGSQVLVWSSYKSYAWGSAIGIHHGEPNAKTRDRFHKDVADVRATTRAPIFMHFGSDLWAPPDNFVDAVQAFNAAAPAKLKLATPTEYFRRAQQTPDIPTLSGEIPSSWPNLLPSWPHLWPVVVPAMSTLLSAEKFSAVNHALGYADYPQQELDLLWKRLLEAMDHNQDGQGGFEGDVRKLEHMQQSVLVGGQILRDMLRNIAERVQIPVPNSFPIVVFNPMGWTRDDVVRTSVALYGPDSPTIVGPFRDGRRLVDEAGNTVPFHEEECRSNMSRVLDIVFVAKGVPSLGYKTYFIVPPEKQPAASPMTAQLKLDAVNDMRQPRRPLGNDVIENAFYRLTVDRATGHVTLFDKALGGDVCRDMEVSAQEERGGNYIGIEPPSGRTILSVVDGMAVEENNAVRAVVRINLRIADILITQRLTLYRDVKRLDVENTVDWPHPRFVRVRQVFPLVETNPTIHYGVPFGTNASDNIVPNSGPHLGDEITAESWRGCRFIQGWIHAGTAERGLTIAADHQFVRLENGSVIGEMVRGTRFTSAKVVRGDEVGSMQYPPPGKYVFRYSLSSSAGDWKAAKAYRAGLNWINPLLPVEVVDTVSTKSLPPTHSFCSVNADNLVVSALKKADADSGLMLRVYEMEGRPAQSPVMLFGKETSFKDANVLEEETDPTPRQTIEAAPFTIKTIKVDTQVAK
jgi:alpha-mannosidase